MNIVFKTSLLVSVLALFFLQHIESVLLKTGATVYDDKVIESTVEALQELYSISDKVFYMFVDECRRLSKPDQIISGKVPTWDKDCKDLLWQNSLIDFDGSILSDVKKVVCAFVVGQGKNIELVDPREEFYMS